MFMISRSKYNYIFYVVDYSLKYYGTYMNSLSQVLLPLKYP